MYSSLARESARLIFFIAIVITSGFYIVSLSKGPSELGYLTININLLRGNVKQITANSTSNNLTVIVYETLRDGFIRSPLLLQLKQITLNETIWLHVDRTYNNQRFSTGAKVYRDSTNFTVWQLDHLKLLDSNIPFEEIGLIANVSWTQGRICV